MKFTRIRHENDNPSSPGTKLLKATRNAIQQASGLAQIAAGRSTAKSLAATNDGTLALKKLHVCTLQNLAMCRGSVSTFADLSVALGAAPCHVQRVHFWRQKSQEISNVTWSAYKV